jgi:murein DD-endopeptidase MepM/ murein hydrolase activator NlpD
LKVGKGDTVREGQVLALVGNTGNSTEPHLHFHLADRASAFDAEGIPYAFASFDLETEPEFITPAIVPFGNSLAIDESGLARWRGARPQPRARELPMRNAIVSFRSPC